MWTFVVADTVRPFLGLDFFNNFGLIIDCKAKKITDSTTERQVNVALSESSCKVLVNNVTVPSGIDTLISKYPSITSPQDNKDAKYCGVYHRIETSSNPPVFAKPRQSNEEKLKAAKEGFRTLQSSGIITPSDSEWSSP